ncbi:Chromatin modification-related protein YNG2 [Neolecta irregularis DAH-3]|uniref:Chromatin modification-related protein YNG2 n=1 Tax=Neolecta irregularis (strain DAH-3) TaxID=1198029 RepID=A0A1U7LLI1_NEOID|nr:Chromatin modification-related protein YNG2 [Neolecta irregularis DAH-3]|eukprot:OLL23507.1 Chromatin modification-related protein YNG2 [Neolecta irregularis DAH-3]
MADAAAVLAEYIQSLDNLPAEIAHVFAELRFKETRYTDVRRNIARRDSQLHKFIKTHGGLAENKKEAHYYPKISSDFAKARQLQDEKCVLTEKALELIDRHIRRLDDEISKLQVDGQIPVDVILSQTATKAPHPPSRPPKRSAAHSIAMEHADSMSSTNGDEDNQVYCYCQTVSYGNMIACDNENCPREWFHWGCVGLTAEPKGTCDCKKQNK